MHTIRLKVNDSIYEKLMWFLRKFSKDEIEILSESTEYAQQREYLSGELNEIVNGTATFMEVHEAELYLEKVIEKKEQDENK